jgi:iron(III) transport system permease protein
MTDWFGVSTWPDCSPARCWRLIYAYLVRFLAVANGSVESGFKRIPPHIDDVARTLGRSRQAGGDAGASAVAAPVDG